MIDCECIVVEEKKAKCYKVEKIITKKNEIFSKNGLKYEEIKRLLFVMLKKEETKYFSRKNGLEYEDIEKLMCIIIKKEYKNMLNMVSNIMK